MAANESFLGLMSELRDGSSAAAQEVFRRYAHRLRELAAGRLSLKIRQRGEEPEDVVQSVLKSFFVRHARGQYEGLDDWDGLWSLLAFITACKCANRAHYFAAKCRREPDRPAETPAEAAAEEPTPEEEAVYNELLDRLTRSLEGRDRDILALCMQGLPDEQISARLGCSERTVLRVKQRVRAWLEGQMT